MIPYSNRIGNGRFNFNGNGCIRWPESGIRLSFDCSPECSHHIMYNPQKPYFAVEPVTHASNGVNLYAPGSRAAGLQCWNPVTA